MSGSSTKNFHHQWLQIFSPNPTEIQLVENRNGVEIWVKRDDHNHPDIQGNKLRKLKYGLLSAIEKGKQSLVTFGGAHSNHVMAVAAAANEFGLSSLAFIRGDELKKQPHKWSSTLRSAKKLGMKFHFLSREQYRLKESSDTVRQVLKNMNSYWLIPEGGTGPWVTAGLTELIEEVRQSQVSFDAIVCPCGTGGTLAGLIDGVYESQLNCELIGIPVLKAAKQIEATIQKLAKHERKVNWSLKQGFEAGGYAKLSEELIEFGSRFYHQHRIKLDRVYNIKSFFATQTLIDKRILIEGARVLIIHTGGLQGGWVK